MDEKHRPNHDLQCRDRRDFGAKLVEKIAQIGAILHHGLAALAATHPILISNLRGKGTAIYIAFVP
ncbi:hypothetical protein ASPWEDRAFT_41607, partial [Aspergillus wentii DTO 134E9]